MNAVSDRRTLQILQTVLLYGPVLLFSVIAHEIAHGYAALKQGDRTALDAGRLSWNPARHIDLFLTIVLPIITITGSTLAGAQPMVFGGAKPVPVDPANYRRLRFGDIVVSLAGVFTNAVIAVACTGLIMVIGPLGRAVPALEPSLGILQAMLFIGIWLNAVLIAFNLLPIPPLDGSHVFKYLLPRPLAERYVAFSRYGLLVLIALLTFEWGERILRVWMAPALSAATTAAELVRPSLLTAAVQWLR